MDISALQTLLNSLSGATVACVGDVMLDVYVHGEVGRISPEAPVPVLLRKFETRMIGAAGNVARNVEALGGRSLLVGLVGDDAEGRSLRADHPGIVLCEGRNTTIKTRYVAGGHQLLRVDDETVRPVEGASEAAVLSALERLPHEVSVLIVSDYAKGVVTDRVMTACRTAAQTRGAVLLVDPKIRPFAFYGEVDIIKPNAAELSAATGLPAGSDAEVEAALARALERSSAKAILVTRAGAGMSMMERGGGGVHFAAQRLRDVFDVSGAGDTVSAALGLALGVGASAEDAVALAILASGVVVAKSGAATATPREILDAVLRQTVVAADRKFVSAEQAAAQVAEWRAHGLRIGFTNGCFDVIHRGHISYLAQASAWCDRLIIGLNTDESVRLLKGPPRPINNLEARGLVLGGMSSVDLIVPFAEETPLTLIRALRPDVLVKGSDYAIDQVVGAEEMKTWGGEVRLAEFVPGFSTTSTLSRAAGGPQ